MWLKHIDLHLKCLISIEIPHKCWSTSNLDHITNESKKKCKKKKLYTQNGDCLKIASMEKWIHTVEFHFDSSFIFYFFLCVALNSTNRKCSSVCHFKFHFTSKYKYFVSDEYAAKYYCIKKKQK